MRMSQSRRAAAEAEQIRRLEAEALKGSTAERFEYSAKKAETDIRDALLTGGIRSEADWRARGVDTDDAYLMVDGVRRVAEVKTGGTIGKPEEDGSWTEANILPKAHYVIFPVLDRIRTKEELYGLTAILTRDEFLSLLAECSRKGIHGTAHTTSGGTKNRAPVIAFQPTPLRKLRERIFNGILDEEFPTVQDYMDAR